MLKKYIAILCIIAHVTIQCSAWQGWSRLGQQSMVAARSAYNRGINQVNNIGSYLRNNYKPNWMSFNAGAFKCPVSNMAAYTQKSNWAKPALMAVLAAGSGLGIGGGYYLIQNKPVLAEEHSEKSSTSIAENIFDHYAQKIQQEAVVEILDYLGGAPISAPEKSLSEMADLVPSPLLIALNDFIFDRMIYNIRYAYDHAPRSADIQDEVHKFLYILAHRNSAFVDEAIRTIDRLNATQEYILKPEYRKIAQDLKNYLESLRGVSPSIYNLWGLLR